MNILPRITDEVATRQYELEFETGISEIRNMLGLTPDDDVMKEFLNLETRVDGYEFQEYAPYEARRIGTMDVVFIYGVPDTDQDDNRWFFVHA